MRAVCRIHTSDQWSRSVVVCPIDPIASRQTSEQLLRLSGCGRGEPDESTGAINEDNHLIWLLGSTQDTVTLLVPIVSRVRRALGACESIEPLPPSTFLLPFRVLCRLSCRRCFAGSSDRYGIGSDTVLWRTFSANRWTICSGASCFYIPWPTSSHTPSLAVVNSDSKQIDFHLPTIELLTHFSLLRCCWFCAADA